MICRIALVYVDFRQARTAQKHIRRDKLYAAGNRYALQTGAAGKCIHTKLTHTLRNRNAHHIRTIHERALANAPHCLRKRNARDLRTVDKRLPADFFHGIAAEHGGEDDVPGNRRIALDDLGVAGICIIPVDKFVVTDIGIIPLDVVGAHRQRDERKRRPKQKGRQQKCHKPCCNPPPDAENAFPFHRLNTPFAIFFG